VIRQQSAEPLPLVSLLLMVLLAACVVAAAIAPVAASRSAAPAAVVELAHRHSVSTITPKDGLL
jgi:hypothetical protein